MRLSLLPSVLACVVLGGCSDIAVSRHVVIVVPRTEATITNGTFHVSLYRFDPMLAGGPATRVFRTAVPFSHRNGSQTSRIVHVHGDGRGRDKFYLAVEGCVPRPGGAVSVLWDGLMVELPTQVVMRAREVPAPCALVAGL